MTRSQLINLLAEINYPVKVKICTVSQAKMGKSTLELFGARKMDKMTIGEYELNFNKDENVFLTAPKNINLTGAAWQRHIPQTPFTTHYQTGQLYLRVMPLQIISEKYLTDGRFAKKEQLTQLPSKKEKAEYCNYVFRIESIRWVEIAGQKLEVTD